MRCAKFAIVAHGLTAQPLMRRYLGLRG